MAVSPPPRTPQEAFDAIMGVTPPTKPIMPEASMPSASPPSPLKAVTLQPTVPTGMDTYESYLNARQLRLLAGPLGLQYLARPEVAAHLDYVPSRPSDAIAIPYHDIHGAPVADASGAGANAATHVRLRMLAPAPGSAKYLQRRGTLPHAYFTPATLNPSQLDWPAIAADPTRPIVITEGEFKSARACMTAGYPPTVGLGGVDSYGGRASGTPLLPELQSWEWKGRTVYICFDADEPTGYKPAVQAAIDRFASTLIGVGAKPWVVHLISAATGFAPAGTLPPKIGLDDYILMGGRWDVLQLTGEEADPKDAMRALLANYVEIEDKGLVVNVQSGEVMTTHTFLTTTAQRFTAVNAKGEAVSLGNQFFKSPRHTRISRYGVWPAHPSGLTAIPVVEADGKLPTDAGWSAEATTLVYNAFSPPPGWLRTSLHGTALMPTHPSVVIWQEFVERFFAADPTLARLFHDWVCYPLRYPDQRNYTSWVLQSPEHGIGKSLLAETVARMVGNLGLIGGPDTFGARFNYSLLGKKFVTLNEVMDEKGFHRQFKAYRTNDQLAYEKKHVDVIYNRNYANFFITTNEAVAYRIDPTERRDIVYTPPYLSADGQWSAFLTQTVVPAIVSAQGLEALLTWYRYDYFLTPGYTPARHAPATLARERMTEASASDNERAARELMYSLSIVTTMPVVENRALREGLRGGAYDYRRITEHLKRLAGPSGAASVVYKAADGTAQRVLILKGTEETWRSMDRVAKESAVTVSAEALMNWLQGL